VHRLDRICHFKAAKTALIPNRLRYIFVQQILGRLKRQTSQVHSQNRKGPRREAKDVPEFWDRIS